MKKILNRIKLIYLIFLGKVFGISVIINFIRNPDPEITVQLLQAFGAKIGKNTRFKRTVYFDNVYEDQDSRGNFSNLVVGDNCYIGDCVFFDLSDSIKIGNNVVVSAKASFLTHQDVNRSTELSNVFQRKKGQIIINDGAWIAFNSAINYGVTIGECSVVAAYSFVVQDVMEKSLYAGVPAKILRPLG